ncbi:nuclear transport factor 2 family protein [Pseudofrankia sp. DC12]|uniref:nuclear transport factor 2 family protein n=1 Tax=Pseudofrankia sp. DC12 TaxID=683315 RepID=UPI000AC7D0FF|nr:nuclear transport factor 2 family protein [Pseudofrankia sp. DC12]
MCAQRALVAAFTDLDVDALVALRTDDAWVRMPPLPSKYRGRTAIRQFFSAVRARLRRIDHLAPVRANGQPAWGEYLRDPVTGRLHLAGILVIDIAGDLVREITRFETAIAPYLGLPRALG